jgi:two-component system NtrC family sensor kinase
MTVDLDPSVQTGETASWELPAEAITIRIRWFGLCVGYVFVNFLSSSTHRPELNGILTLGAAYALLDTFWSRHGRVFLSNTPLFISLMEAIFIGLLCYFDAGPESLFRYYYFLSLLVCAFRYSPWTTYLTLAIHVSSYAMLAFSGEAHDSIQPVSFVLTIVFLAWVTWASTAMATLVLRASKRLAELNFELQQNQRLLEQRIAERTSDLQQSQAMLVQQEKQAAFGLLAAGIAHEVGNPLAAISGLVQMMNRKPLEPDMHERLGLVDEQLRRIQRTLRELVDFSRPASRAMKRCDIQEVIEPALNIAKYYKRMKGKRIETQFAPELPPVEIVRDQMLQVFLNLILNALDSTQEGGVIQITTRLQRDRIEIVVQDDGHGIRPEDQGRLFQPYFTTKETGTGLGLFVCRNIVQDFNGTIELMESNPQGTSFRVTLPPASTL